MAKARTETGTTGAEAIEAALKSRTETFKEGFEKATQGYEQLLAFGKDNTEAALKSANIAGKGIEALNTEVFTYSRNAVEDGIAVTKAIMGSKSIQEVIELQSDFAKTAFESYVAEFSMVRELALATAKEFSAPLQGRATAFAGLVQETRVV